VYVVDQIPQFDLGQFDPGETFESVRTEPEELIDAGDHVVTPMVGYFRGRDEIEVMARFTYLWTFRDGTVARVTLYQGRHEARVYQGRDGVIQAFREWFEPFSEFYIEPLDFIGQEDRVIIPQRHWGIGSASGVSVELEVTHVYEVRDSQIARVDEYDTLEEALEAAGLRG
jgi:ketosteroid isomerase-like protein